MAIPWKVKIRRDELCRWLERQGVPQTLTTVFVESGIYEGKQMECARQDLRNLVQQKRVIMKRLGDRPEYERAPYG